MPVTDIHVCTALAEIDAVQWNGLAGEQPFLRHEFLSALESSGCVARRTGWIPQHLTLCRAGRLVGAMPLYLKLHSYGEYVFDWAWAQAYQRHGLDYYPKLVSAVPFTPVSGPRLLAPDAADRTLLLTAAVELAREVGASSLHILFPAEEQAHEMRAQGLLLRSGVQFHWHNRGYADFDAFLTEMSYPKRKKIRQERRKVEAAGIEFTHVLGGEATEAQWKFFHECYRATYLRHGSMPYLSLDFFRQLGAAQPDHVLLVLAYRAGRPIAAALNLFDGHALYGRYWGALEDHPGLHFETCYYQAIRFCIDRRIGLFEGGAQGEHKLARGFLPTPTWSAHWLADAEFSRAVAEFLAHEAHGIAHHMDELNDSSPFKTAEIL